MIQPPGSRPGRLLPRRGRLGTLLLAILAYVPALTASPGRMPTDTKLYLYLDPGRLLGDAAQTWDNRQFLGWVPHQVIAYLWPSGPWFWVFDKLGVPDWIAHRLWIGTLLVLGGLGARWAARHLGLPGAAALCAALVYQLSPYVLPYVSRTSVMLLPWAAVGWLTGLTIRAATRSTRRSQWREAALFALVILTVGAVNATALAMIAPAPILWLVHAAWQRTITWRRAVATSLRIGALSIVVSLWWIVMLLVQGGYGADVLAYSETLRAVSLTSVSTETLRGLGYWLFYVRDPFAATTTASVDYMESGRVIVIGFALLLLCLTGLAATRWANRRYAALLVAVGIILAVGVHPIDDPSPLVRPLTSAGLSLALRSSTRALPLSTFGLALGAGALVAAVSRWRWRPRLPIAALAPVAVAGLAILNLPALWTGGFVDPALTRDQSPPDAWLDAVAALDASSHESRVLQLPGQEFGAFRWGYTVDPPLPGLTSKPMATRDLLPLGGAGAMDLLDAFDDRLQTGTLDPASVAVVARFLAADRVWLSNDAAFDRFRTPRPERVAAIFAAEPSGLGEPVSYGTPVVNAPSVPMIDETALSDPAVGTPVAPVQLVPVDDPVPMIRATTRVVVLAGSGDGIVDAAAVGLLHGDEAVVYVADANRQPVLANGADADPFATAAAVIVTDSNRDRAHQWRGSQDVTGFTETGGPNTDVLREDDADQRLPVFAAADGTTPKDDPADQATNGQGAGDVDPTEQTVATLADGLVVRATAYGEAFAYRPEDRPAMAVDGDPRTAWVVADRGNPIGERIEVSATDGTLRLLQPAHTSTGAIPNRMITSVRVRSLADPTRSTDVALDERSLTGDGQRIEGVDPAGVSITILTVDDRPDGTDTGASGVGFAELGVGAHEEIVRVPTSWTSRVQPGTPLSFVFTRLREEPLNRWRDDPEHRLIRQFELPADDHLDAAVTVRLSPRADDAVLARVLGAGASANRRMAGGLISAGWNAVDGDAATAWTSPFGDAVGSSLTVPAANGSVGVLQIHQPTDGRHSLITGISVGRAGETAQELTVGPPDADGISAVLVSLPVPGERDGSALTITITSIDARTTIDRRFAEPTVLPVSIVEITGQAITAATPAVPAPVCRTDLLTIDGSSLDVRIEADDWTELMAGRPVTLHRCSGGALDLATGTHLVESVDGRDTGLDVDRVVLSNGTAPAAGATQPAVTVTRTNTTRTATVSPCPDGCWLIMGEGYNRGWTADAGGDSLGRATQISGGFNGWWLPPSTTPTTVTMTWEPQRRLDLALGASALAIVGCCVLIWRGRRGRRGEVDEPLPEIDPPAIDAHCLVPAERRPALVVGAALVVASGLVIAPTFALVALPFAIALVVLRRSVVLTASSVVVMGLLALLVLRRVLVYRYGPDAAWPGNFEDLHHWGLFVVVLLAAGALLPQGQRAQVTSTSSSAGTTNSSEAR